MPAETARGAANKPSVALDEQMSEILEQFKRGV